jgi:hypothetical protein
MEWVKVVVAFASGAIGAVCLVGYIKTNNGWQLLAACCLLVAAAIFTYFAIR